MKFSVVNLGCKVNRVESDQFAAHLIQQGWVAAEPAVCDVVIINTCTVTGEAEKKTRKAVRRALRETDSAHVIVTGCAAVIDPRVFNEMSDRVIVEPVKSLVEERINELFEMLDCEEDVALAADLFPHEMRIGDDFVTRVGIKVQDGCDNACTYCIVHKARGKAHSRHPDSVVEEVVAYSRAKVNELVLTGINVGSYCYDTCTFSQLLTRLLESTEHTRFRLSSVEPHALDDDAIKVMSTALGRICRHLHLPLQSGSSRILKKMGRPYDADDFLHLVEKLRKEMPTISLSTDVIVGFPSETEDDFEQTVQLCKTCGFSKIHVFPYSKRKGTPASEMADQVTSDIRKKRTTILSRISDELSAEDIQKRKGSSELALVEAEGWATTESYHRIKVDPAFRAGDLVTVIL